MVALGDFVSKFHLQLPEDNAMFMISRFMYEVIYKPYDLLKIESYEPKNHISNFYYFRLGALNINGKVVPEDSSITIAPNGFETIWSYETFKLSGRVMGLLGNHSKFVDKGLQLVHSPSIDPGFPGGRHDSHGSLSLGIKNNTAAPARVEIGEKIGKVIFFDVSDTIIETEKFIEDTLIKKQLEQKRKAALAVLKMINESD